MLKNLLERYRACMVLHGVGDAMGYHNGLWEMNTSGEMIHKELELDIGGVVNLELDSSKEIKTKLRAIFKK